MRVILVARSDGASEPKPHARAGARSHPGAAGRFAATLSPRFAFTALILAAPARCGRARRTLLGNGEAGGYRLQIEHLPNEIAERHDELSGVHRPPLRELRRRARSEPHLFLGAQQDDVRQRGLDRIANPPRALRARPLGLSQLAQVSRIDREVAGKRSAERLVRRDQGSQAFVDLPILPFAPLLHRLHQQQADAHADERDHGQTEERREQGLPGAEIQIAHAELLYTAGAPAFAPGHLLCFADIFTNMEDMRRHESPPRLATWLLEKLGSPYCAESLAGDLLEQWRAGRGNAWYWRQVLVVVLLHAWHTVRLHGIAFAVAVSSFWVVIWLSRLVNRDVLLWGYRVRRSVFDALASTSFALDISIVTENAIGLGWFAA